MKGLLQFESELDQKRSNRDLHQESPRYNYRDPHIAGSGMRNAAPKSHSLSQQQGRVP